MISICSTLEIIWILLVFYLTYTSLVWLSNHYDVLVYSIELLFQPLPVHATELWYSQSLFLLCALYMSVNNSILEKLYFCVVTNLNCNAFTTRDCITHYHCIVYIRFRYRYGVCMWAIPRKLYTHHHLTIFTNHLTIYSLMHPLCKLVLLTLIILDSYYIYLILYFYYYYVL